jgi:hypothetical protein
MAGAIDRQHGRRARVGVCCADARCARCANQSRAYPAHDGTGSNRNAPTPLAVCLQAESLVQHLASDMASEDIEAKTLTLKLKTTTFEVSLVLNLFVYLHLFVTSEAAPCSGLGCGLPNITDGGVARSSCRRTRVCMRQPNCGCVYVLQCLRRCVPAL